MGNKAEIASSGQNVKANFSRFCSTHFAIPFLVWALYTLQVTHSPKAEAVVAIPLVSPPKVLNAVPGE